MSFSLQLAGKIIGSDDNVYFCEKFSLFFYETKLTTFEDGIEKEFKYISNVEYLNKTLSDSRTFEIYENYENNIITVYNLEKNNLMLPAEIIQNLIETFTLDINNIIEESNVVLMSSGKKFEKFEKIDLNETVKNDIYT